MGIIGYHVFAMELFWVLVYANKWDCCSTVLHELDSFVKILSRWYQNYGQAYSNWVLLAVIPIMLELQIFYFHFLLVGAQHSKLSGWKQVQKNSRACAGFNGYFKDSSFFEPSCWPQNQLVTFIFPFNFQLLFLFWLSIVAFVSKGGLSSQSHIQ
jgi:hypothetical protein